MTYREQLNKLEELGITPTNIEIANSCNGLFEFNYSDEEFEKLCRFAERTYFKSDALTTSAIACYINDLVNEDGKTIEEILEMDKWDFINKASNYLD